MTTEKELLEPVKAQTVKHEAGFEFTDLGKAGAENIKRIWTVDEITQMGVKIAPVVRKNVNGTLYLLASMNGKIDTVYFSKKMQAQVAEGQKLSKKDVVFYTMVKDGETYVLAGRPNAGDLFVDWD